MAQEGSDAVTWSVIECMGNGNPTVVFDGTKPRRYVSIRRRDEYRNANVTAAIGKVVSDVVQTKQRVELSLRIDNYPDLTMIGLPVVGPFEVPFGVQLWLGPQDEEPTPPRLIGAFDWDPKTLITHHGPTIESQILAIEDIKDQRVSPEVFRHFEYFPRDAELGPFITEVEEGRADDGETFDSPLTIKRADGVITQAYMTMRAVQRGETWSLRGIVHDVTDVQPPDTARAFDRRTARTAANMADGDWGIGHFDFSTQIVTEWPKVPATPLDKWVVSNAEYHPDDLEHISEAQKELVEGTAEKVEYVARIRFADDDWISVKFTLTAATPGPNGHGLMRVELANSANEPDTDRPVDLSQWRDAKGSSEDDEPEDDGSEEGGVLLW